MTTGRVSDQADDRREAFRLGPGRPGRSGRLDRPAPRATWREPAALAFHGSAIRFYDPVIDAWRSARIEPVKRQGTTFHRPGHRGRLVLQDPQLRWRFTGFAADSSTWRAEASHDRGATWHFDQANAGHPR